MRRRGRRRPARDGARRPEARGATIAGHAGALRAAAGLRRVDARSSSRAGREARSLRHDAAQPRAIRRRDAAAYRAVLESRGADTPGSIGCFRLGSGAIPVGPSVATSSTRLSAPSRDTVRSAAQSCRSTIAGVPPAAPRPTRRSRARRQSVRATASATSASVTVTVPWTPSRRVGHAAADTSAQSNPAIVVPGVGDAVGVRPPATRSGTRRWPLHVDHREHRPRRKPGRRRPSEPTPIGTRRTSNAPCARASSNRVA